MNGAFKGRYTANRLEPFVVFLIGMRVNQFRAVKKWLAVVQAMGPMMQSLAQDPEKGLLGSEMFFRAWPLETCMVSYWRSFEDLTHFARNENDSHWPAWQQFMRDVGADGSVGIWHETYRVAAADYECIYSNMPAFGLAAATTHVPISEKTRMAKARMGITP